MATATTSGARGLDGIAAPTALDVAGPASGAGLPWPPGHGAGRRRGRRPLLRGAAGARRRDGGARGRPRDPGRRAGVEGRLPHRRGSRSLPRCSPPWRRPTTGAASRVASPAPPSPPASSSRRRTLRSARRTARLAGDEHPDRSGARRRRSARAPAIASTCCSPVSKRCRSSWPTRPSSRSTRAAGAASASRPVRSR